MSWEAWGSGPEPFDTDVLYRHGWQSDEDGQKWWRYDEVEHAVSLGQAIEWYMDFVSYED